MARTKTRPVGRTPLKRRACEVWLGEQLAGHPRPARILLEAGGKLGWGWATVRRAKRKVDVRSIKKGNEWWWFDPKAPSPAAATVPGVAGKIDTDTTLEKAPPIARVEPVEPVKLPEVPVSLNAAPRPPESPQRPRASAYQMFRPTQPIERREALPPRHVLPQKTQEPIATKPPVAREPVVPKPPETLKQPAQPAKPRRVQIWESALQEAREVLIATARFTDLYIMRADIWLRQEQLRERGRLKEAEGLNEILARVNEALEQKKREANIESNR
jgi:hypothetical protein